MCDSDNGDIDYGDGPGYGDTSSWDSDMDSSNDSADFDSCDSDSCDSDSDD
jgi:hypothetical protein